ncbi:hypothetical protein AGMMS49944_27680 [Spirochaetia bacterium]|nr:hypothetical protein AGMMS49944_27680 [Spirochaetia bacterium]
MKIRERGVKPQSSIYFHTPNEVDRKLFLFPTSCGHYFCDAQYRVYRERYLKYLILYVQDGQGYVYVNKHKTPLFKGDVFLLDCYNHHVYGTESGLEMEILWVHFDGMMADNYFKTITRGANCTVLSPRDTQNIYNNLYNIYEQFHEKKAVSEILNNKYIVNILTDFLLDNSGFSDRKDTIRDDLLAYITDNIQLPLKLEELAERASPTTNA